MPKHGKYKKVRNQPSVPPMLNATTSAKSVSCDNSRSASDPQEANGLASKKGEGKPETQLEVLHKTVHID